MQKVVRGDTPIVKHPFKPTEQVKEVPNEPETVIWDDVETKAFADTGTFIADLQAQLGASIEGLKTALAESGKSLSDFGTLAQQAPKRAKTAVDELNATYRQAVKDAKNLALMQGETSEAFYEAQLRARNLKSEIEGLNQVVGQTGQIAGGSGGLQQAVRGFDGLGNSVNQLTRELPAFTYSMQASILGVWIKAEQLPQRDFLA